MVTDVMQRLPEKTYINLENHDFSDIEKRFLVNHSKHSYFVWEIFMVQVEK